MPLQFTHTINLSELDTNPSPKVVNQLAIIHEAEKGEIVQYYIDPTSNTQGDKKANAIGVYNTYTEQYDYYDYPTLIWGNPKRRITTRKIDRLGIKTFPSVGSIAFYKLAYQVLCKIVAPVNNPQKRYPSPTQVVTVTDATVHVEITDPVDDTGKVITYQCYRVSFRCDDYAEEYITYDPFLDCPLPRMNGEFEVYTQGYISEGEEVSEFSPSYFFTVNVPGQSTTPPTTTIGSDIFVAGLRFTQDNKLLATLTDGRTVESSNIVPEELPAVDISDKGKFLMVDSTGKWSAVEFATIVDPLHHQLLRFNSVTGKWENYTSMDQIAPESAAHIISIEVHSRKFIVEVDSLLKNIVSTAYVVVQQNGESLAIASTNVLDSTHLQVTMPDRLTDPFDVTLLMEAFKNPQTNAGPYHCAITDSLEMLEEDMEATGYVRLSMSTGDGATFGGRYFTRTSNEPVLFVNISDGGSWNSYGVVSLQNSPPANTYNSYGGLTSAGTLVIEGITFYMYAMGGWWSNTGVQYTVKGNTVSLEHGVIKEGAILKHSTELSAFLLRYANLTE